MSKNISEKQIEYLGSILSYRRSINPTLGLWYNTKDKQIITPIEVKNAKGTGSVSNYISEVKAKERKKEQQIETGNPFSGDICETDIDANGIMFTFSIIITPDSKEPDSNNLSQAKEVLQEFSYLFEKAGGYRTLSEKYVSTLLSGRVLWRNRIAFNKVMTIKIDGKEIININIDDTYCFNRLLTINELSQYVQSGNLLDLVDAYETGLTKEAVRIDVVIKGEYPGGIVIYPSQEFSDEKEKTLSSLNVIWEGKEYRQATTHSQKIGNALRTIDDMKEQNDKFGITPIEVYGYTRHYGMALRTNSEKNNNCLSLGTSFYNLLKKSSLDILKEELKNNNVSDDALYFTACLIRGGIYGTENDQKSK